MRLATCDLLLKSMKQRTLGGSFTLKGKGLHTGLQIEMRMMPAPENSGYTIRRVDLPGQPEIKAVAENVCEATRGTVLRQGEAQVSTVEHGFAALYASGIDNCLVEVNAPEFPILDGSARLYMDEIAKVGTVEQSAEKNYLVVKEKLEYTSPDGLSHIEILPADDFSVEVEIDFTSPVLGHQTTAISDFTQFAAEIAPCRTFVFVREIAPLLKMNLIRGGDLNNALVIYDQPEAKAELQQLADLLGQPCPHVDSLGYLSPLRFDNEPARHKLLDLIGDLSLVGQPIRGRVVALRPGHSVNTAFGKQIREQLTK